MARRESRLAVPAATNATLMDLYAAAALTGLLASQRDEPDPARACKWAGDMGRRMAMASLRHHRRPAVTKRRK